MNDLKQQLMDRLEKNLSDYHRHLTGFEKQELIDMAPRIAAVQDVHRYLTNWYTFQEGQMEYLLLFQNPLEVVTDAWEIQLADMANLDFILWSLCDRRDAHLDYPLMDSGYTEPSSINIERNDTVMNDTAENTVPETVGTGEPLKLDVSVRPITPKNNLLAFASVKIADCFVVDNIKIVAGEKGLFVNMPSAQDSKGKFHDVAFPVTADFRQQLQTAILDSYAAAVEKVQGIGVAQKEFTEKPSIKDQLREGAKASAERAASVPKSTDAPKRGENAI